MGLENTRSFPRGGGQDEVAAFARPSQKASTVLGTQALGDGGADEEGVDAVEQGGDDGGDGGVIESLCWDSQDPVEVEADLDGRAPSHLVCSNGGAPVSTSLAQSEGGQEKGGGALQAERT